MERTPLVLPLLFLCSLLLISIATISDAGSVGVNYGRIANNLPSAVKVVSLLKSQGIERVKVYDTDPSVLRSLSNSGIKVTVDLPNQQLQSASTRPSFANTWVLKNVLAYYPHTEIEAIAVGNEVFVDPANTTKYLVSAMQNIHASLIKHNLDKKIKISSPIALSALQSSYPASAGSFRSELIDPVFKPLLEFLRKTKSFLMVNAYPFFAYEANSDVISLDYALFRSNPGNVDAGNGLKYYNLFDAQVDAVFAALSALKYDDINVVVSETGWPSKGDENEVGASVENAAAYNGNLVKRILTGGGTPLRPKAELTVFLFALFNENQKPGPSSEQNYGLFYPNEKKVYDVPFNMVELKHYKGAPSSTGGSSSSVPSPRGAPAVGAGQRGSKPGEGSGGGGEVSPATKGQTWCVANVKVGKDRLQQALDYACGGGADCGPIQPDSACYDPDTVEAHASYAFNSFYQKNNRAMGSCDFEGAAYVVSHRPRIGKCDFPTGY